MSHKGRHSNTVQYYDKLYTDWIGKKQTQAEVNVIKTLTPTGGKILDIACGTGRHTIPLLDLNYSVIGIQKSEYMKDQLLKKNSQVKLIHSNFLSADINDTHFNSAICIWNALFEIALTKKHLQSFFEKLQAILVNSGKVLLSTSDADNFEPQEYDFTHKVIEDNYRYELTWSLLSYYRDINTTIALEHIEVYESDALVDVCEAKITQRHWTQNEIIDAAEINGFSVKIMAMENSTQKYFLLSK